MDENMTFSVLDENGAEVFCEALFTLQNEKNGKYYIVYTDNTLDELGNTKVYASTYDPGRDKLRLEPLETEAEWAMIEQILDELQQQIQDGEDIPGEMILPLPGKDNIIPFPTGGGKA